MSTDWVGSYGSGRCAESGNQRIHAHLLGGNYVDHSDLAPSAVLCVVFCLAIGGVGWRYWQSRVKTLFVFIASFLATGLAFAVHAAIANTSPVNVNRSTVIAEQILFVLGQLLLIAGSILYTRRFLTRVTLVHWPSTFLYFSAAILVTSFILACVAFSRAPTPVNSFYPSLQYSQLRIAAVVLPFILVTLNALLLPFAKMVALELPGLELGLLLLASWFLWVPAFYAFCVVAITADSSPLVCSQVFFYLSFGLFTLLSVIPFLALPSFRWGFTLLPGDLIHEGGPLVSAREELHAAMAHAAFARAQEAEEAQRLRSEQKKTRQIAAGARFDLGPL
ncbi:hypothetical protein JCM8547_006186 [Rhodosporidiobolus lusitaniae]